VLSASNQVVERFVAGVEVQPANGAAEDRAEQVFHHLRHPGTGSPGRSAGR